MTCILRVGRIRILAEVHHLRKFVCFSSDLTGLVINADWFYMNTKQPCIFACDYCF